MGKLNIGVIFGGRSVEHEVSVITGLQAIENLDKSKYNVVPIFVSKEGDWYTGEALFDIKNYKDIKGLLGRVSSVYLPPIPGVAKLNFQSKSTGFFKKAVDPIVLDAVIPAFHGTYGEDGAFQGLMKLANIPYAGCRVMASAVGMDKIVMKDIFKANGIPTVNYTWFMRKEYQKDQEAVLKRIESQLKYPVYVKPANLGSSIGISRAQDRQGLMDSIDVAAQYDRKIIIEESIENLIEINCSVLGTDHEVQASVCEQPVSWESFLSFDDKYMRSGGKGMKSATRNIPAPIGDEKTAEVQALAMKAFQVLDCSGVSRIDFLMEKDTQAVYVNEINTIPGSFSFYLWEPMGITFGNLLDRLVQIAIENHREENGCLYSYDTELLQKADLRGSKAGKMK